MTDFRDQFISLPVYDTHTHLKGPSLPAADFWDIGHYFWFIRELQAAGYPEDPMALDVSQRVDAFWNAFQSTRNTSMNWVFRTILRDLYGTELTSKDDISRLDEAVQSTAGDSSWPAKVCETGHIRHIVTNVPDDAPFPGLPDVARVIPRLEGRIKGWMHEILDSADQQTTAEAVGARVDALFAGFAASGYPGVMTSGDPYDRLGLMTFDQPPLSRTGSTKDAAAVTVLHHVCAAAARHGLFVQLFVGVEKGWGSDGGGGGVPSYDPDRILNLYGLFQAHDVPFELILGDGIGNSDAINAARIWPNVHIGGMWWYNFRASTYRTTMQHRFEALPAAKSSLVVSDARCIEWSYGKIQLIKRLLADFMRDQVADGWIDAEGAEHVARTWLHDAADALYERK